MTFSPFDRRLLDEGLAWFDRPRLASLLEMLGATSFERVETLVTMLRNSPPEEFEEAVAVFERASVRAARKRMDDEESDGSRTEDLRRRRASAAAERREQRRRSG